MPENTTKVDRTTVYGNPFDARKLGNKEAVLRFRLWLTREMFTDFLPERRDNLLWCLPAERGRNLACWCAPDLPCHADVLLELANAQP